MNTLYPLKFTPILKDKIWGGERIQNQLNKPTNGLQGVGESWEISAVDDNVSVVANGFLQGNDLEELIEIYMGDLVGDAVFDKFGTHFPLLIKFIDANANLSVQVHPDDELSAKRHNSYGKTEMWYIMNADKDAEIIIGFNSKVNKDKYIEHQINNNLKDILKAEKVHSGDAFFVPAGTVHSICKGVLLAEIQQTSDITYRIYDWDRLQADGTPRELHIAEAVDAITYDTETTYKKQYNNSENKTNQIVECKYFTCNKLKLTQKIEKDFIQLDSFIIYMCTEGTTLLYYNDDDEPISISKGETVLVPAMLKNIFLEPTTSEAELLEIYIETNN